MNGAKRSLGAKRSPMALNIENCVSAKKCVDVFDFKKHVMIFILILNEARRIKMDCSN